MAALYKHMNHQLAIAVAAMHGDCRAQNIGPETL